MKNHFPRKIGAVTIILFAVFLFVYSCTNNKPKDAQTTPDVTTSKKADAFLNHRDSVPSQQQYNGPLFVLSHDYPKTATPLVNPSWQQALRGQPISSVNAIAYIDSLKSYVAANVLPFFTNNKGWTAAKYGWFQEPWMGSQREAIQGVYFGNPNPAGMFTSLREDEDGYALVLYDSLAAYTVGQIWGTTGQKINLANDAAQFKEGSVIVKLAFSNINYPQWPVMQGAETCSIYDTVATSENPQKGYQVRKVSFFQMDIIVKDSKTAPKTGWVYSTFVYDLAAKGNLWDKMVPLGAMWGNDPDVKSPIRPPYPKLYETVINPNAPQYSRQTLGWGGRLSGPNDGAIAQSAIDNKTGKTYTNLPLSSCMSCHSPAQYNFNSFLLPGPSFSDTVYTPGSAKWNLWFRDDYGNVPFDNGQTAMDYDMVMAFKSVNQYLKAQGSEKNGTLESQKINAMVKDLDSMENFRQQRGKSKSHN
jgi:hypothetical protein